MSVEIMRLYAVARDSELLTNLLDRWGFKKRACEQLYELAARHPGLCVVDDEIDGVPANELAPFVRDVVRLPLAVWVAGEWSVSEVCSITADYESGQRQWIDRPQLNVLLGYTAFD